MMHRLRYAMAEGPFAELMTGTIEADETYVGGRRKRVRGESKKDAQQAKFDNKISVVALVNRDTGKVRATVMPRVTRENLASVHRLQREHEAIAVHRLQREHEAIAAVHR